MKEQYDLDYVQYKNDFDAWEKQRNTILNDKKNYPTRESKKTALDLLGKAPELPLTPLLICPDPTFEGLCKLMENGWPSLGVFSSEGGQFLSGYSMNKENKTTILFFYLLSKVSKLPKVYLIKLLSRLLALLSVLASNNKLKIFEELCINKILREETFCYCVTEENKLLQRLM